MSDINVAAVLIRNEIGHVLTVRKCGTELYMFPGGKLEAGEDYTQAAERETREELGVSITEVQHFGAFDAPAANEPGYRVHAEVFTAQLASSPTPNAEIEDTAWVDPFQPEVPLAPLLAEEVFPTLRPAIKAITVFCGSALGSSPAFASAATALGQELASHGMTLVYGGGRIGLMGTVADAVIAAGGQSIGVIPTGLADKELAHRGVSSLEIVADMHQRKMRMAELGDAFVALPGGAGTLEELFEAWVWLILGIHDKPVALYGRAFWAPMLDMLEKMRDQGFIAPEFVSTLIVADSPTELLRTLHTWTPPRAKWS